MTTSDTTPDMTSNETAGHDQPRQAQKGGPKNIPPVKVPEEGAPAHFVMFHMGRCGSTVLQTLLQAQGNPEENPSNAPQQSLIHEGEIFARLYGKRQEKNPDLTPGKFIRNRVAKAEKAGALYGCEIKYQSGTHLDLIGIKRWRAPLYFSRRGFTRFILLTRENLLDRIISQRVAKARGSYVRAAGDQSEVPAVHIPLEKIRMGSVEVSLVDMLDLLDRETRRMRKILKRAAPGFLELSYEADVMQDPNRGARRIADHIGLPYRDMPPAHDRIVTRPMPDQVENYDALVAALKDTRFATMLTI